MAITARLVGKLGGADIEKVPVSITTTSSSGTYPLHTVDTPEGERYLVVVSGNLGDLGVVTGSTGPRLQIGGTATVPLRSEGPIGLAVEATGPVEVSFTKTNSNQNSFTGTVWWAPLD